jgi:hypothetical protein
MRWLPLAGFPTLQALVQDPRAEAAGVAAVQAAFEGAHVSTRDKLPLDQQRYGLRIPLAMRAVRRSASIHDDGKPPHRWHTGPTAR